MMFTHDSILDSTGMYPLKEKGAWKSMLLHYWLPAACLHIVFFLLSYWLLGRGEVDSSRVFLISAISLIPSALYVLIKACIESKEAIVSFLSRYEFGRRIVFSLLISLGASFTVIFYFVVRWELVNLWQIHVLLFIALIVGNILLFAMSYELASYIMFGVLTFLVSALTFTLTDMLVMNSALRSISAPWTIGLGVSFVAAVTFAYITNRYFVFKEKGNFWTDFLRFVAARIFSSLVLELLGMYIFVDIFKLDKDLSKQIGSFLVTIANYFLSKFFVFTKKKDV